MALLTTVTGSYLPSSAITTVFREAVKDLVTMTDPLATPLLNLLDQVEAESTVHQFIVDTRPLLVGSDTAGAVDVDGINIHGLVDDFTPSFSGTGSPYTGQPRRLTNIVQIFGAKFGASDSLRKGRNLVGIRDPYTHEQVKATGSIQKAKERRMFEPSSVTAFSNTTVRRMSSLVNWITTTPAMNQVTVTGVLTAAAVDSGAEAAITAGGRPRHLFCGIGTKFDLSAQLRPASASVINSSNINAAEYRVIRNVDWYEVDGIGAIQLVGTFQIPETATGAGGTGKAYLLDIEKMAWAQYVPYTHIPLAKTSYGSKGIVVEEGTYENRHPGSHTVFNEVTT